MSYESQAVASIVVQDTGVTPPVVRSQDSITDLISANECFYSCKMNVGTSPETIQFGTLGIKPNVLLLITDTPITITFGIGLTTIVRSVYLATYDDAHAPTQFQMNTASGTANVKIFAAGDHI